MPPPIKTPTIQVKGFTKYTPSDADLTALKHNLAAVDSIHNSAAALKSTLDGHIDRLWALHEKVVRYENTDDTHLMKIDELDWRSTIRTGAAKDLFSDTMGDFADMFIGFAAGFVNLVQGLYGVLKYLDMGLVFWITKPMGTPDSVTEYMSEANDTIGTVLADPMLIFEGIAQDMGDTLEEKGICYFIGSLIPDVAGILFGARGIDKIAKIGKVRVLDDVADVADAAGDIGRANVATDIGNAVKLTDILSNKDFTNSTGKVDNYASPIQGIEEALADFNALNPINVRAAPNGTILGDLSNGTTINIHPGTSVNYAPTLQIFDPITKKSIKIRY